MVSFSDANAEKEILEFLKKNTGRTLVKSKSAQKGSIELSCEVTLKNDDTSFITELSGWQSVSSAVLVSYNGDYMG